MDSEVHMMGDYQSDTIISAVFYVLQLLGFSFFASGLMTALHCDWILAAIAQNWAAAPSRDIAPLY